MPEAKKSGGSLSIPLMIVAFLAMAGFLYWLSVASEPTDFAVAEETPESTMGPATALALPDFAGDPSAYVGQRVRMSNLRVGDLFGAQAFWILLPSQEEEEQEQAQEGEQEGEAEGTRYLVRLDPQWIDAETQLVPEDVITMSGMVRSMSDSVISAWEGQGVFTDEGQRPAALELESFIEADEIQIHSMTEPETDTEADTTAEGDGS